MKTTLLASTALVLSVGAAAAADFTMADTGHDHSITLSGDARMGIINNDTGADLEFTSRARVQFTGAGETDGGLGFGFNFRSGDHGTTDAVDEGLAGSVFISQGGHTLAMGDVDSAAKAAVGNVSGVGLTGLGDLNEVDYALNDNLPAVLYSYTGGALSFHVGLDNGPGGADIGDGVSLGVAYDAGTFNLALGYEDDDGASGVYLGGGVSFGAVDLNAIILDHDSFGEDWAVSADFTSGATTFTAFAAETDGDTDYGLGASHDLGGGASLVGGIAHNDSAGTTAYDLGVSMTF